MELDRQDWEQLRQAVQQAHQATQQAALAMHQLQQTREQREQAMQRRQQAMERIEQLLLGPVNGLSPNRIGRFEHFAADESLVGEQCIVCLEDLEVGTQMVRLDCHVNHYLCKTCTDEWFKDHKTCPTCNHIFN